MIQAHGRALQLLCGSGGSTLGVARDITAVSSKDGTLASLRELAVGALSIPRSPPPAMVLGGDRVAADAAWPTVQPLLLRPCMQSATAAAFAAASTRRPVPPARPGQAHTLAVQRDDGSKHQSMNNIKVQLRAPP